MIPSDQFDAFKNTLLMGGYNLLLGAGISLDSHNHLGETLRGAETLRQDLCALKAVNPKTTLPRVYALLTDAERARQLVERFSKCKPSNSLHPLPRFLWRRLFTFNIDDVLESLYATIENPKQSLVPLNFDAPFEPTPERKELHAVHLHGWVGQPTTGFVFSNAEYARVMSTLNPWMHLLSEILATESFIIAGTSLNEVDLEYYLSHRSEATPRRSRGPSLLIEPYPDAATESDCSRYGLILVKATFGAFLEWLQQRFPAPPTLTDLIVPHVSTLFPDPTVGPRLLRFFADFRLIAAGDQPRSKLPSAFLYGREPQKDDLDQHLDIPREDNGAVQAVVDQMLTSPDADQPRLLLVLDDAGTGKTTLLYRVAHEFAKKGQAVLAVHALSRIDVTNAASCLASAATPVILLVDGLADHAEQIHDLLQGAPAPKGMVVLAAERSYRQPFVDLVLGEIPQIVRRLQPLNPRERRQLIESYRAYGLIAERAAVKNPALFANRLKDDPVAIAVCRILNDFRPLDGIVESLWAETTGAHKLPYLCVALAQHCHVVGLRHSILQAIVGPRTSLAGLYTQEVPLGLTEHPDDDEYGLTLNSVVGERILLRAIQKENDLLFDAFCKIGAGLAPYVNRRAIMLRSPEARLAGRLFDVDKIVKPLLGNRAERFYVACQPKWEWNSRYWEQRALLAADTDLMTGLQYARHAVAIERHPFTLTTLGKLLLSQMEGDPGKKSAVFCEAFENLSAAIHMEGRRSRIRVHPYATLFSGTARYLESHGRLSADQQRILDAHMQDARDYFNADAALQAALNRLERTM
jgi:hypothetical protein